MAWKCLLVWRGVSSIGFSFFFIYYSRFICLIQSRKLPGAIFPWISSQNTHGTGMDFGSYLLFFFLFCRTVDGDALSCLC